MGVDPLELRYKNIYRPGDTTPTGQTPEVFRFPKCSTSCARCTRRPRKGQEASPRRRKEGRGRLARHLRLRPGRSGRSRSLGRADPDGVTVYNILGGPRPGRRHGCLGHRHEALRPLGIAPEKIKLVMNDTASCPTAGLRRQPPAGHDRQRHQERLRQLLAAMRKADGTYRTYDEMVAENIPLRYTGKWAASMCTACDENCQGKPVPGLHVRRLHGRSGGGHQDRQDHGRGLHGGGRRGQDQQPARRWTARCTAAWPRASAWPCPRTSRT